MGLNLVQAWSQAKQRLEAAGRSARIASRMAPEPTPRSSTDHRACSGKAFSATSTTVSVSGRGVSTSGVTRSMIFQKPLRPRMWLTGSRFSPRAR